MDLIEKLIQKYSIMAKAIRNPGHLIYKQFVNDLKKIEDTIFEERQNEQWESDK